MKRVFAQIQSVGFDLDGTLYPTSGEIDDRIRTKVAEKILEVVPEFKTVESARAYFEEQYSITKRATSILKDLGYESPSKVMDECIASADVLDLISPNPELARTLTKIGERNKLFLLTSSPRSLSYDKLERLGINPEIFYCAIFGDSEPSLANGTKPFHAIPKITGVNPENHVYVGDRVRSDIIPAKEIGMVTIYVGEKPAREADFSIRRINEIGELLL